MTLETGLRDLLRALIREELAAVRAEVSPASSTPEVPGAPSAEYVDDRALAEWIGLSRETLQQLRRGTEGPPFVRVARRAVRYHVPAVRAWLASRVAK